MPVQRILSTGPLDEYAASVLGQFGNLVTAPDTTDDTMRRLMDGAIGLVVRGIVPISAELIQQAVDLKVIGRSGVGYSNVDIEAATARRIPVIYTPGAGARAVAEASFAFMFALVKKTVYWNKQIAAGNWNSRYCCQGGDLDGATVGIIGLGRIGQLVAEISAPFRMQVLAFDPHVQQEAAAAVGARLVTLDTLLAESDFICVHCPQTEETTGLINRQRLTTVKRGAFLINLARGGIIESLDILYEAVEDGRLAGVALDVFEPEPPDWHHPIFQSEKCLTAPHSMASTENAMRNIFRSMADDMAAVFRGQQPKFAVNPEVFAE